MRVAIGSTRRCKVDAVEEAWKVFSSGLGTNGEGVEFRSYQVSGSGNGMPLSVKELMAGAEERAESLILQLKRERAGADFYVGLEGGFNVVDSEGPRRQVFLESWAYVTDGLRGSFGHGGGVPVPSSIANQVIDRGIELGIVIDRFSGKDDIRSQEGTWGILTREIFDRKHSFVVALIAAFAPFYNQDAYSS